MSSEVNEADLLYEIERTQTVLRGEAPRAATPPELLEEGTAPPDLTPLPQKDAAPRKSRRGVTALWGDGIERTIAESWAKLLEANAGKRYWTDEQLVAEIRRLFPDRHSKYFSNVARARKAYNAGKLPGMVGKPKVRSFPYGHAGGRLYELNTRGTAVRLIKAGKPEPIRLLVPLFWKKIGVNRWRTQSGNRVFEVVFSHKLKAYGCVEHGKFFAVKPTLLAARVEAEKEAKRKI